MTQNEALALMGLEEPFSQDTLNARKREKFFKTHPDHGGSEEAFIEMRKAYDILKPLASEVVLKSAKSLRDTYTIEGDLLADLGKGFGPDFNGMGKASCSPCKGRGYVDQIGYEYVEIKCQDCKGTGVYAKEFRYKCKCCTGGKFTQRNGREVECRVCKGSGIYVSTSKPRPCIRCWGLGYDLGRKKLEKYAYRTCRKCKGLGEVELNNPVLPANALVALRSKTR